MTTVVCLDDYHSLDRTGRKEKGVTALDPAAQDFELMYDQIKALKEGQAVGKPIYNHVTGILDPPEEIKSPNVCLLLLHCNLDQAGHHPADCTCCIGRLALGNIEGRWPLNRIQASSQKTSFGTQMRPLI